MSTIKLKHSGGNSVSLNPPTSAPTSSDVAFKLPNADGSANQLLKTDGSGNLGFVAQGLAGITEFDMWHFTTTSGNGALTGNLVRTNLTGSAAQIGTGVSESSGIFSFPNTGKWLVIARPEIVAQNTDTIFFNTQITTNNSSYTTHGVAKGGGNGTSGFLATTPSSYTFADVTDTSNVKVKFVVSDVAGSSYIYGHADGLHTQLLFIRLGDT